LQQSEFGDHSLQIQPHLKRIAPNSANISIEKMTLILYCEIWKVDRYSAFS